MTALVIAQAFLLAGCDAKAPATEAVTAPPPSTAAPIRIVRLTHADAKAGLATLQMLRSGCFVIKHQAETPMPVWDRAKAESFFEVRTEELFSGNRHAVFESRGSLAVDNTRDCSVRHYVQRTATVETGCKEAWSGSANAALGEEPAKSTVDAEKPSTTTCPESKKRSDPPPAALRTHDAGLGVACFGLGEWTSAQLGQPPAPPSDTETDMCLYAKQPFYAGNPAALVVVRAESPAAIDREFAKPIEQRAVLGLNVHTSKLEAFSDGTPIGADRFEKAAVESWLRQPTSTVVAP